MAEKGPSIKLSVSVPLADLVACMLSPDDSPSRVIQEALILLRQEREEGKS